MTYKEAAEYLNSFVNYEKKSGYDYSSSFRLERVRRLSSLLGNPHEAVRSIHIAGTKGKGSTAAFVHSILKEAGFRVGLYTSPHLISFRERIRIGDRLISEEDVARLLERVRTAVSEMEDDKPSFFEVYTALAYLYFKASEADFAVYEVGMGGRLDATNIITPFVSAITPISYEHTDKLGTTLDRIAAEKAGIIKEGGICVSAPQEPEAFDRIVRVCGERRAKLIMVGGDILVKELEYGDTGEVFAVKGLFNDYPKLETRLLGAHQVINAATAIGVVEALHFKGIDITPDAVIKGVKHARWEGRLEVLSRNPLKVLDGAQNRASAKALREAVRRQFKYNKLVLVFGVSDDKDIRGILDELLPITDTIILTKANVPLRAMEPSKVNELIGKGKNVIVTLNAAEAMAKAEELAGRNDLILVAGSLFLVGEVKALKECARII